MGAGRDGQVQAQRRGDAAGAREGKGAESLDGRLNRSLSSFQANVNRRGPMTLRTRLTPRCRDYQQPLERQYSDDATHQGR